MTNTMSMNEMAVYLRDRHVYSVLGAALEDFRRLTPDGKTVHQAGGCVMVLDGWLRFYSSGAFPPEETFGMLSKRSKPCYNGLIEKLHTSIELGIKV